MNTSRWMPCVAAMLLCSLLLLSATGLMALQVGDKAPDFSLSATTADKVSLADYLGKKHVVLFFDIAAFAGP
jgi:uncharacterized lipoprotein YmbA